MNYHILLKKKKALDAPHKIVKSLSIITMQKAISNMSSLIKSRESLEMLVYARRYCLFPVRSHHQHPYIDIFVAGNQESFCSSIRKKIWGKLVDTIKNNAQEGPIRVWIKGNNFWRRYSNQISEFNCQQVNLIDDPQVSVAKVFQDWSEGKSKDILFIYARFISLSKHEVVLLHPMQDDEQIQEDICMFQSQHTISPFLYSLYLQVMFHNACLETCVSEYASKGLSMRAAKDSTDKLIEDYTIKLTTAKQGLITQELNIIMIGK